MRKFFARRLVRRFGRRYDYDTGYLEQMLDGHVSLFFRFAKLLGVANHRRALPRDAYFAGKIVGALAEDCGPCVQLVVTMGAEAGVPDNELRAIAVGDRSAMSDAVRSAYDFASALCREARASDAPSLDDARMQVAEAWGEAGVMELSVAVATSRVFPFTKRGMGLAKECQRVDVGSESVVPSLARVAEAVR